MGVYIDMEMPVFEHQSWDIRKGADGKWYVVDTNAETSDGVWHEIVPVPEPHGRLIDADLIMEKLSNSCKRVFGDDGIPECSGLSIVADYIESASTVIPASKEGM